ncbi:MAG: SDR family NAD(P)-dependent oxidoreductase [Pseudonocardiaceae bacterium]|nr:SDR family NAD(P)-dependent oxidoreductase [Pseudonocardiaceae bacterium]
MVSWSIEDIPDQTGRTALVTGANSGLGYQTATILAQRGAHVLLGCRDPERGREAAERVRTEAAGGLLGQGRPINAGRQATEIVLDLADLGSVRKAAAEARERTAGRIDILVNNAGVMATPPRRTADGFELQLGTNHLGHAALTWLLAPALPPGARVVTVSSLAHRGGGLDLDDLHFDRRRYNPVTAYSASKLANLLFALELDRCAGAAGRDLVSVAAHPGLTDTELAANSARMRSRLIAPAVAAANKLITQGVVAGTLPQLYAATAPDVRGGEYFGPMWLGETRGGPARAAISAAARDPATARLLWEHTAELVGVVPDPA